MQEPPPDPDRSPILGSLDHGVIETIYSASGHVRGIISRDSRGVFRVCTEFWDTSDWEAAGQAFWAEEYAGILTDTLERARELCWEHILRSHHARP